MEIIRDLDRLAPHPYPVVAFGNFDGVHLGHRRIFETAIDRARAAGGTALALTFDPLPAKVLAPSRAPRLILTPEDKLDLLSRTGLDGAIVIRFTIEFSRLTPREFVRDYIVGRIGARAVVVGHSVSFGHNRAGNASVMVEMGREFGLEVTVVGAVKSAGIGVSSSKVRELIAAAELKTAAELLGRYHFLSGQVVRGRERGRRIGFPTVNLEPETECVPPDGVYPTRVILEDGIYPSITNIGIRPTFNESERTIEAHIFDFDRELYGEKIKLEFVERIRPERKFDSPKALSDRIALDVRRVKEILKGA